MEVAGWAMIGVMVTLGGLLRRQIAALDTRLNRQMGALISIRASVYPATGQLISETVPERRRSRF